MLSRPRDHKSTCPAPLSPEARAWAVARLAQGRRTWLVDVRETGLTEAVTQDLLEWSELLA